MNQKFRRKSNKRKGGKESFDPTNYDQVEMPISQKLKFWDVPYEMTNDPNFHEFVQRLAIRFEEYPFIVVRIRGFSFISQG